LKQFGYHTRLSRYPDNTATNYSLFVLGLESLYQLVEGTIKP
jgi:hypothetical protein